MQSCGPLSEALMHTAIKYPTSQEISQVTETTGEIEFTIGEHLLLQILFSLLW